MSREPTNLPYERPMPTVKRGCFRCAVDREDVERGYVIVSPRGTAHYGLNNGDTACGIDATGDQWWWPL